MDEFEQDDSRSSKITLILGIIICFVIIVGLTFGLIFIKHEQRTFQNEINATDKLINDEQDSLEMLDTEISNINKEIEENSNIIRLTAEQKELYPSLASELEQKIKSDEIDAKIAYLTFDDGPYIITNDFLDTLDAYDVRATFFALEKDDKYGFDEETSNSYDLIYQRIINEGHTLANHTSSHNLKRKNNGIYNSVDNFMEAVLENRNFILDRYGYKTEILRFPGGSSTAGEMKDEIVDKLNEEHYGYVDWNSMTGDGEEHVSVNQSVLNVVDNTNNRKFLVVLMHDYNENTLYALPDIIEGLRKQGYTLLPLFYDSIMVNKN